MKRTLLQTVAVIMTIFLFSAWNAEAEQKATRVNIDISKLPFKGSANAPVVMVVFSDYL